MTLLNPVDRRQRRRDLVLKSLSKQLKGLEGLKSKQPLQWLYRPAKADKHSLSYHVIRSEIRARRICVSCTPLCY